MLVHPACFQDAFGNVPLIRCPLKSQKKKSKFYYHKQCHSDGADWLWYVLVDKVLQLLTLVRHFGYSWSPGRTLKEIGTLSARRLAQKASQIARWTALYTTSKPVKATKAMGRQHSSGGSSHCEPAIWQFSYGFTCNTTISTIKINRYF